MFLQGTLLALDDSVLDADQIDNLIKFCPTKEEMELLKVEIYYDIRVHINGSAHLCSTYILIFIKTIKLRFT